MVTTPEGDRAVFELARFAGDGYDRAEVVERAGWHPLASWGRKGWDLGDWPYVMVYTRRKGEDYQVAVNVEGDTDVETFETLAERNARIDSIAAFYWKANGNGPTPAEVEAGDHIGPMRPETWAV